MKSTSLKAPTIAAVLPCYRTAAHVLDVVAAIGPEVQMIVCVDDACPQRTGELIRRNVTDPRVEVLFHDKNQGVGGAVCTGYVYALLNGADVLVKIDSDGQMDPAELPTLVDPILQGWADYTKGNRFFNIEDVTAMPVLRLVGNAGLSFLTKVSAGYWSVFDPTNGYTAIHARVLERIPLHKLARRYFFESDLLFRLGTLRARVLDVPMPARYGSEQSSMQLSRMVGPFLGRNLLNAVKRIFYNYFLRDFSVASLLLVLGAVLSVFGFWRGIDMWIAGVTLGRTATSGQVMMAALPMIVGTQMLLSFIAYDVEREPRAALHPMLRATRRRPDKDAPPRLRRGRPSTDAASPQPSDAG